jgi:hypothetical protein
MKNILLKISLGTILVVSGCATAKQYVPLPNQSVEVENPEMTRIYVLRPSTLGAVIPMAVKDGDQLMGETASASYLCWERPPGDTQITGKAENESWVKNYFDKGKRYYVLQRMQMGAFIERNKLEILTEEEGKKYLKKCHPPKVVAPKIKKAK